MFCAKLSPPVSSKKMIMYVSELNMYEENFSKGGENQAKTQIIFWLMICSWVTIMRKKEQECD